jgi:hypothetical protein
VPFPKNISCPPKTLGNSFSPCFQYSSYSLVYFESVDICMFKCSSVRPQGGVGHSKSKRLKTRVTSNRPLMGKGTPILTIPKYKVPSKDTYIVILYDFIFCTLTRGQCKYLSNIFTQSHVNVLRYVNVYICYIYFYMTMSSYKSILISYVCIPKLNIIIIIIICNSLTLIDLSQKKKVVIF